MTRDKYTVISLFSGAMGLDIGLESTGKFEVVACIEKVPAFCDTIRLNRDIGNLPASLKVFEGDISDIDASEVLQSVGLEKGELDLLVGGPPCQSFSTAGKRASVQDPRGSLLWQYLRFVEMMRPKFFLMENVRGLVSAALKHRPIAARPPNGPPLTPEEEKGSVIKLFANDLQSISGDRYHMDIFEVNSVNYGAPQIRERALFIGNRFGVQVDFPDPTHVSPEQIENVQVENQVNLFADVNSEQLKPWATLRDALKGLSEKKPEILDFSPRKKSFLEKVPPGSNWRSLPEALQKESMGKAWFAKGGRSGWWRRLTYDLPSPTLITMPNHASTSLCHPEETRALSVSEYSRIQEFPNEWKFAGKTTEKYTQIGNAVPVRLGRIAGEVISNQLEELKLSGWPINDSSPQAYRIIYIRSHVRTRSWFKNGQTVVWETGDANKATHSGMKTTRKFSSID